MKDRIFCTVMKHRNALKWVRVVAVMAILAISLAGTSLVRADDIWGP